MNHGNVRAKLSRTVTLAKVAVAAGRVAAAGERSRDDARRALAGVLADARGAPLKVGQLLGSFDDDGPFRELANGVPPRPWTEMEAALEAELGRPWRDVFEWIDEVGLAASLGQVHHARLRGGFDVAIKIQYPDIADAVATELAVAGLLPSMGPMRRWGFDLAGYKSALRANLDRELDYQGEAERQARLRTSLDVPSLSGLVIPYIFGDLCSERLLVQSWEAGAPLSDAASWPSETREALAGVLMRAFFGSVFVAGEVHGDPHLGNLRVRRETAAVVLYDFGCTLPIARRRRLALLKLILGCRAADETDAMACFVAMGFDAAKLAELGDMIPSLAKLLLEPMLTDSSTRMADWRLGERVNALLGDYRWWFRAAGPPELIMLLRAFHGLAQQLTMLNVSVSWWAALTAVVPAAMQREAVVLSLADAALSGIDRRRTASFAGVAKFLRIEVTEREIPVVTVSLPASQTPTLTDLIPSDVLPRIRTAGIDVDAIVRDACGSGLCPQDLFDVEVGDRRYHLWLT